VTCAVAIYGYKEVKVVGQLAVFIGGVNEGLLYRGADKFLARPGRKQATATEDFDVHISYLCQSQWPRGLRRRSTAARLLRSWLRIPPEAWIFVC